MGTLRFNLLIPRTVPAGIPTRLFVGVTLDTVLSPFLRGPLEQRDGEFPADVYPIELPEGAGIAIPLPLVGDLEIYEQEGRIVIGCSALIAPAIQLRLGDYVTDKKQEGTRTWLYVRSLLPGESKTLDIAGMGALGIEAV